jgi:endonuclease/exonuclease/phosphatase family metal-dependent hydrolase
MCFKSNVSRCAGSLMLLGALFIPAPLRAQSNLTLRVMAANITSANGQSYEAEGIRIFQGLKPDIVAIQEFQYGGSTASNDLRTLVNTAFGAEFSFYCEPNNGIPNGIVSRWPIIDAGWWDDPFVTDRDFAWARIDLPGTNDLYVVSVHLYGSGNESDRGVEANIVKAHIQTNFPANAWVVVGGDFNAVNRGEMCVDNFKTILSDSPIPSDRESGGDEDTNANRNKPYDYVLPSFAFTNRQVPVVIGANIFPKGLVFDSWDYSTNYTLGDVAPVQFGDSHVANMQHMAVIKDFMISTNSLPATNPPAITSHPLSQTNALGGNVTFTVAATGADPLTYQWRFNGTNISGATLGNYALTNVQSTNAGDYTVVITNSFGSATSDVATLTVNASPFINSQPQSLTVNAGANATFNVTAAGGAPLSFEWRFNGSNLAAASASSYTRTNAQSGDAGNYTVVISNYAGSVTSAVAVLTVNTTPPGVVAQWNFNSVPADGLTTTGSTTPSAGAGTAALVGGATASFATGDTTVDPAGTSDNSGWNTANYPVQNAGNKTRGIQFNVSTAGRQNIIVTWSSESPNTGNKYARLQYTTNGTTYFDFPTATTNGTTFTSKTNSLSSLSGVNDNPNFAFQILSEFESTAINSGSTAYVAANPSSTYGSAGSMRYDMVTILGAPIVSGTAPTITNQPSSQIVAQDDNATFSVGADGTAPLTYQWQLNLTNISGATGSSYTRSNVQPAHLGSYSVVVSNSAGFTTSSSAALNLVVPPPVLGSPAPGILQWSGLSNLTYTVQSQTNLADTNWATLGTVASPDTTLYFTNQPATDPQRFYRVIYP